jgi:TonB-dependent receptor
VITGRVANANGQYLENAQIAVKNTTLQVFTDASGTYRLTDVPSGSVILQVLYTGLETREITVAVPAGGAIAQDIELSERVNGQPLKLDPYTITASREMSVAALAVNEQRFAPNIKNVVAADAFGDISQGNVGEFIKYLPSISADFADPNVISVQVRGLPSNLTQVTSDGSQLASAHTGGSTRVFQFDQVSINNLSRVELTKVPTPADPADSLGGIINLVSKSAFERKKAQFNYRIYLNGRQGNLTASRLPDPLDKKRYRVLPNADFTYTVPVNDRFGLVLSGISANSYDERHVAARVYNTSLANSGASVAKPFFQSFILQDAPRFIYRDSLSLKGEWRATPNSVLSVSFEHSGFLEYFGMNQLTANSGGNALPTAGGQPLTFGPDFTRGATGRGTLVLDGQYFDIRGATDSGNVRYRFDNGTWQIKASASQSKSTTRFDDTEDGHFYSMTTQLSAAPGFIGSPFTVNFLGITHEGPRPLEIRDAQNQAVDITAPKNYQLATASSLPRDVIDEVQTMNLSIRRRINRLAFPLALEGGAAQRTQKRDTRLQSATWTYNGPDGNPATVDPATPYLTGITADSRDAGYGFLNIPWVSNTKAYAAWKSNPALFTQTLAQQVAAETFRIGRSEAFQETVSAGYLELEARFLRNRLRVLGGVRYEKTVGKGQGPLSEPMGIYVRAADGSFAHDSRGALIRKPEAGAVGSLDQLRLTLFERAARARRSYDGYYPSLHLTYNIASSLQARLAYAKTYGRPNFNQIIPNATINDFDTANAAGVLGTINVRNPALRPWSAHNYDLSIEHYTNNGGVYSVGVYQKDLDGFFEQRVRVATAEDLTALDLEPRYVGYQLTTTYNLGKGHASGWEFNARQSLDVLGRWGRWFDVFGNTTLYKEISGLRGKTINAGVTFRLRPITLETKVNYRGETRRAAVAALGPDAYEFEGARTTVDLNLTYSLSARLSVFLSSSNALDDRPSADRRGSQTPEYARRFREQQYGALYSLGVRGTF